MQAFAQLLVDPLIDGNAETPFGSIENFRGHLIPHGALEDMLGFQPFHLHRRRNARADEFNQLMIEQRHTHLQGHCHAHAIYLREDVAGQVRFAVEIEQWVERVAVARWRGDFAKSRRGLGTVQALSKVVGIKRRLVESREDRNVFDITIQRLERDVMYVVAAPRAVRKHTTQRLHNAFAEEARQLCEGAAFSIQGIARVTGKEFVATIAREHNLDVVARQL